MEMTVDVHNLLGHISLPRNTSQGGAGCRGRRRRPRQISEYQGAILVAYEVIDIPIGTARNNVFGSGSPERITDQGKAISRSSPDGLPHDILETPGTILVPDQFVNMAIRIHCAGIRYLLRLAIRPARACQYGIF